MFSDVLAGGLWACSVDGELCELAERRGIGGVVAPAESGWVLSGRSIVHVRPSSEQREIRSGDSVCGFSDLSTTADGELLAGAALPASGRREPASRQLLAITPAGGLDALRRAAVWPHGIGVSPDGRTIYVSDYATRTVYAMQRDGSDAREFCRSPRGSVDGLAIDAEGGLWWPSVRAERLRGSSPMVSCTS